MGNLRNALKAGMTVDRSCDLDLTDREIATLTRQKRGLMQKLPPIWVKCCGR